MTYKPEWCVVELEPGVWLADWPGDPGRTLRYENALRFVRAVHAERELALAREYRPFKNARIVPSDPPREGTDP